MKYIITESQISRIIKRYLDSIKYRVTKDSDGDIFLGKEDKRSGIFWFQQDTGELLIDPEIYENVKNIFGISDLESRMEILMWFEDKFDRRVSKSTVWEV
jgi:hypothetical protein